MTDDDPLFFEPIQAWIENDNLEKAIRKFRKKSRYRIAEARLRQRMGPHKSNGRQSKAAKILAGKKHKS